VVFDVDGNQLADLVGSGARIPCFAAT
jgi:hypothetical protein